MAKIAYNWSKVNAGDIVSFIYENKDGRKLRRTILVIEPKFKNRSKNKSSQYLIHGIQLEISNIRTNPEIKKILETAGQVEIVDEAKKSILAVGLMITGGMGNLCIIKSSGLDSLGLKPNI